MLRDWLRLMRPGQWIKNGFVFAPLLFSIQFPQAEPWRLTLFAALAFLLASSAVYVFNDLHDASRDRLHPVKRLRPLAAGRIAPSVAAALCLGLLGSSLLLVIRLPPVCTVVLGLYLFLNMGYTYYFKRIAVIDVTVLASFYVLRVLMGGYAIAVEISPWIILTTYLLALFLGFGKRYHESGIAGYEESKPSLREYSRELLDKLVVISGGGALITYAIYAAEADRAHGMLAVTYTTAFVAYGLFRYLQRLYVFREGGEPELVLLKDPLLSGTLALWLLVTLAILAW